VRTVVLAGLNALNVGRWMLGPRLPRRFPLPTACLNALNVGRWMLGGRRDAGHTLRGGLNALNVGRWMLGLFRSEEPREKKKVSMP